MLAIKNNIMAANAARYLGRSYDALASSVERLSSGLRINSAKDDAAGMAVRELLRGDIAVMQQGSRNAQDGISMLQTTEGAMQTIDNILTRMKQLAEQAATGLYSTAQRQIMDNEFGEIADEVERIANSVGFNGVVVLNNTDDVTIRFGTGDDDAITVTGADMTKAGLGIETGTGRWSATTSQTNAYADADTTTVLTVAAGDPLVVDINFTDADDTDQEEIQVSFAAGTYTLQQVVDAINLESNNPTGQYDAEGRFLGYSAASIVETADGKFKMKLSARDSDIDGMTVDINLASGGPDAGLLGIFGEDETAGLNLMAAGTALFEKYNETTGLWEADTAGDADAGVNILTAADAESALTTLDSAIAAATSARASFGAKMNRMENTVELLGIQTENLMTAESRISDVDVATEMALLTRNQVLAQAGTAMLAQANSIPQMALTLLR